MKKLISLFASLILLVGVVCAQQPDFTKFGGEFWASNYGQWGVTVVQGNTSTGAGSIIVSQGVINLPDTRSIAVFATNAPITILDGSNTETVTPTGVSNCGYGSALISQCTISATFSFTHGAGAGTRVISGTFGLQEAINDAHASGGGSVDIDGSWNGTNATFALATAYFDVSLKDVTEGAPQIWNMTPSVATVLATPATLTAVTALPSATPVGAYGTGTYHLCISYVDLMGNEGPCSLDFSEAGLATGSFIFSAPAASTGAVGYTIYISLTAGTYALAYQVPITSTICTMTTIEDITPACALANTTYGQAGATATVTAITVNTAPLALQASTISSTTDYVGNTNARTTYAYAPGSRVGLIGIVGSSLPFPAAAAPATTVPTVLGTLAIHPGFMNYVGKTIRICGTATEAAAGSQSTITSINFWWDAPGSNAAGVPVNLGGPSMTNTLVTANRDVWTFCQTLMTTVAGAGVTAGSIQATQGYLTECYMITNVCTAPMTTPTNAPNAAVASLNLSNLTGTVRIHVVYLHTTATDAAGPILQNLTIESLN